MAESRKQVNAATTTDESGRQARITQGTQFGSASSASDRRSYAGPDASAPTPAPRSLPQRVTAAERFGPEAGFRPAQMGFAFPAAAGQTPDADPRLHMRSQLGQDRAPGPPAPTTLLGPTPASAMDVARPAVGSMAMPVSTAPELTPDAVRSDANKSIVPAPKPALAAGVKVEMTAAPSILAPPSAMPLDPTAGAGVILPDDLQLGPISAGASASQPVAGAAPPLPFQAQAPAVAQQIAAALRDRGDPAGPVDITLDPPELGRLRMSLTEVAGTIALAIQADRAETADLIRRHLSLLAEEFARAGLDAPSVEINNGQAGARDRDTAPQGVATAADRDVPEAAPTSGMPTSSRMALTGGLDLRL